MNNRWLNKIKPSQVKKSEARVRVGGIILEKIFFGGTLTVRNKTSEALLLLVIRYYSMFICY